jgi:hypothetical protein
LAEEADDVVVVDVDDVDDEANCACIDANETDILMFAE